MTRGVVGQQNNSRKMSSLANWGALDLAFCVHMYLLILTLHTSFILSTGSEEHCG